MRIVVKTIKVSIHNNRRCMFKKKKSKKGLENTPYDLKGEKYVKFVRRMRGYENRVMVYYYRVVKVRGRGRTNWQRTVRMYNTGTHL